MYIYTGIMTFVRNKKYFSLFFALLFLISAFLPIITPKAKAAGNNVNDRVFSYQAYRLMAYDCIWQDGEGSILASPETWMQTNSSLDGRGRNSNVAVGSGFTNYLGGAADTARVDCDNADGWIDKALGLWGFSSPEDFLNAIVKNGNGGGMRQESDGGYTKLGSAGPSDELTAAITKTLQNTKYYKGSSLGGMAPEEIYFAWLSNFTTQCGNPTPTFSDSKSKKSDGDTVSDKMIFIDDKGKEVEGYWHYANNGDVAVGSALTSNGSGTENCDTIVNKLKDDGTRKAYQQAVKDGRVTPPNVDDNGDGDGTVDDGCSVKVGILGFLICGVANIVDDFAHGFENMLIDLLRVNPLTESNGLHESWVMVKNVASVAIVLFALVIIASQMFGFEFLNAYTVKKAVPRLFIAVIAIQLSWFLATFCIGFMNALGDGIQALLLLPFGDLAKNVNDGQGIDYIIGLMNGGTAIEGAIVTGIVGLTAFSIMGGIGALIAGSIIVGAAVIVGFFTLVLRIIVIWGLLVIMPIALVMWVLPGTQKYWDQWWGTFWKLLFMYPLIIGLLTVGKIGAYLAASSKGAVSMLHGPNDFASSPTHIFAAVAGGASEIVVFLIVLVAYFGPYFMIPSSFKFGGTLFSKATGAMQGMGSKWGSKAGDRAGKAATNKIATGYKPGTKSIGGKFRNAAIRGASGKLVPGSRTQQVALASAGVQHEQEQVKNASFLMDQAERNMEHGEYLEYLEGQMASRNEGVQQAAFNKLIEQKGYANLEKMREGMSEAHYAKLIAGSGQYSNIKQNYRALLPSDDAIQAEKKDVAGETGEQKQERVNAVRRSSTQQMIEQMSEEEIVTSHDTLFANHANDMKSPAFEAKLQSVGEDQQLRRRLNDAGKVRVAAASNFQAKNRNFATMSRDEILNELSAATTKDSEGNVSTFFGKLSEDEINKLRNVTATRGLFTPEEFDESIKAARESNVIP